MYRDKEYIYEYMNKDKVELKKRTTSRIFNPSG